MGCNSDLKHPEFIGLTLGDGAIDLKRHGLVPVDVTPSNMWWNWHGQGCTSSGFPCWNRGCERSDAIPGARGAHVGRLKTTVSSYHR